MPIWAPPVPDRRTIATELSHTMTSVTIRFRRSYFSDEHGKVISYAVIVTEDYSKPTDNKLSLLTWHDVQHFRLWPPYKTADPFYPFTNSSVEDYTIGVENCENKVRFSCKYECKLIFFYHSKSFLSKWLLYVLHYNLLLI